MVDLVVHFKTQLAAVAEALDITVGKVMEIMIITLHKVRVDVVELENLVQ